MISRENDENYCCGNCGHYIRTKLWDDKLHCAIYQELTLPTDYCDEYEQKEGQK